MQLSRLLFCIAFLLAPVCLVGTTWLYLYPLFHGCAFPVPPSSSTLPIAPFRLLALGDPQLEGDSSLPKPGTPVLPSLRFLAEDLRRAASWNRRKDLISDAARRLVLKDVPKWFEGKRKIVDLWGNDYYLAHIVRSLRWWTQPSHVAVLGDLLGSQWVSDGEFERRAERYWGRVFKGMEKVPDAVMEGEPEKGVDEETKSWGRTVEALGADKSWESRVINIAGNHDVGYAGDMSEARIERFERAFGKAHWDIVFNLPQDGLGSLDEPTDIAPPALRLIILNSMNLDTPALSETLQRQTYDFMNHVIGTARPVTDKTHATILLTHIPLHKESGICVDSPFFSFYQSGSGVKEQNMLSEHASKIILEGIFGLNGNPEAAGQGFGRRGIILNGHDHEGCDVMHYVSRPGLSKGHTETLTEDIKAGIANTSSASDMDEMAGNTTTSADEVKDECTSTSDSDSDSNLEPEPTPPQWHARRYPFGPPNEPSCIYPHPTYQKPQIREITLRSMMGDFSGYAGFLSAWFDPRAGAAGEWKLEFKTCGVGVQHWWWAVHIVDVVALAFLGLGVIVWAVEMVEGLLDGDDEGPEKTAKNERLHTSNRRPDTATTGSNRRVDTTKRRV
ncbi:hypothetical protein K505DRAFT_293046 [Melanomma pulvis-pyrius CBS 109.77]|uniref:Calcineurin-like phosphoesterase domain-containing protein n=1 Tax=Melanomma pulvis-pyrius CBS 109.77 TaxID=1314802 RepID=A0A6A6XUW5_9PLEO|nr:hypothetical protein K505DRAFT_293046 [Melanomma pulvis-pyrius CBS 109.77]